MAGLERGRAIDQKVLKDLAPSILAASNISEGKSLIKDVKMKIEMGSVRAMLTNTSPKREFVRFNLTNIKYMGITFTCPGIARPIEKSKNKTFPLTVIDLAIANDAILASNRVSPTEKHETIKLFRVGVRIRSDSNSLTKFSKLQLSGSASGSESIFTSVLKVPRNTIEQGIKIRTTKTKRRKTLVVL
jgi:hypothetical protein